MYIYDLGESVSLSVTCVHLTPSISALNASVSCLSVSRRDTAIAFPFSVDMEDAILSASGRKETRSSENERKDLPEVN